MGLSWFEDEAALRCLLFHICSIFPLTIVTHFAILEVLSSLTGLGETILNAINILSLTGHLLRIIHKFFFGGGGSKFCNSEP